MQIFRLIRYQHVTHPVAISVLWTMRSWDTFLKNSILDICTSVIVEEKQKIWKFYDPDPDSRNCAGSNWRHCQIVSCKTPDCDVLLFLFWESCGDKNFTSTNTLFDICTSLMRWAENLKVWWSLSWFQKLCRISNWRHWSLSNWPRALIDAKFCQLLHCLHFAKFCIHIDIYQQSHKNPDCFSSYCISQT